MRIKKGVSLGLLLMSSAAFADGDFYIGAGGGGTNFESSALAVNLGPGTGAPVDGSYDDSDGNVRLYGGYRLNPNFAVEAVYSDLGEFEIIDEDNGFESTFDIESFDLAAVAFLPLWEGRIDLFVRAGIAFWSGDAALAGLPGTGNEPVYLSDPASSGEDLFWSIGLNLNLLNDQRWTFRSELTTYEISDFEKLETLGFNIQYRF